MSIPHRAARAPFRRFSALLLAIAAACGGAAHAEQRVIRVVVPYGTGAVQDTIARAISDELGRALNASIVVENRAGAGGTVGTEYVGRQPADGYTILMGSVSTHGSAPCVYSKLPYDALKDFTPLTVVA
ncbi:ABC transporter substrate-binding protein, partial [Achromobacter ruhlandii]